MPELPEVEAARQAAERVAVGRTITRADCAVDPIVFEGVSPARIRRALLGRRVEAVGRHGKHFWLALDRRPWPVIHFGMTGGVHTPAGPGVRLISSGKRSRAPLWPPRFTKLRLVFDDGGEMAIADARRLGRIRLRQDPSTEPPISVLGFDALRDVPTPAKFRALMAGRSAPIKALLLDQSFAAGVGNWIADEVLYQAGIDPRRRAGTLDELEIRRLRAKIKAVVATAVRLGSDSDRYPRTWLFHHRWGRNAAAITGRGEKIRHDTIGGRTTAWVPKVQR
ncbi:MAG TPA: DNA-formamidopyrimidine glycosylase family protein [Methylomirabilota bacterium]|jgi:formamidopyrimidine-DNA glycosylase